MCSRCLRLVIWRSFLHASSPALRSARPRHTSRYHIVGAQTTPPHELATRMATGGAVGVDNVFRRATEESIDGVPKSAHSPTSAIGSTSGMSGKPKKSGSSYMKWSKSRLLNTLRCGNFCNGICLIVVAIVAFIVPTSTLSPVSYGRKRR